jgi:hypothetical protein
MRLRWRSRKIPQKIGIELCGDPKKRRYLPKYQRSTSFVITYVTKSTKIVFWLRTLRYPGPSVSKLIPVSVHNAHGTGSCGSRSSCPSLSCITISRYASCPCVGEQRIGVHIVLLTCLHATIWYIIVVLYALLPPLHILFRPRPKTIYRTSSSPVAHFPFLD